MSLLMTTPSRLLLLALTPLDEREATQGHVPNLRGDLWAMLQWLARPMVMVFAAAVFLYVMIEQGVGTWLPTFNAEILHLPAVMSVQAASLFAASLALGRLVAGGVIAR